jgi:hypothetical protein
VAVTADMSNDDMIAHGIDVKIDLHDKNGGLGCC